MYTITFAMLAFFCAYLADNTIGFRVGGLSELQDATPKTQQLVDSVSILVSSFNFRQISFFNFLCKSDKTYVMFYITNRCEMISLDSFLWDTTESSR